MIRGGLAVLGILSATAASAWSPIDVETPAVQAKQITAPPREILDGSLKLPAAEKSAQTSSTATIPVTFVRETDGRWVGNLAAPKEISPTATVMLLARSLDGWEIESTAGGRVERRAIGRDTALVPQAWAEEIAALPITGMTHARVVAPGARQPKAMLHVADAESSIELVSHLGSAVRAVGEPLDVVSRLTERSNGGETMSLDARLIARIVVPDGRTLELADASRATFVPRIAGTYDVEVVAEASIGGKPVLRTVRHSIAVAARPVVIDGTAAVARAIDVDRLAIAIPLRPTSRLTPAAGHRFLLGAEVWGTTDGGHRQPVAWIGGIVESVGAPDGSAAVATTLDGRWLALAGARAPLELREVRLTNPDTNGVVSHRSELAVVVEALPAAATRPVSVLDDEMLGGRLPASFALTRASLPQMNLYDPSSGAVVGRRARPLAESLAKLASWPGGESFLAGAGQPSLRDLTWDFEAPPLQAVQSAGKKLLVHGQCASDVWAQARNSGHFTNYATFLDLNQSRSHDEFAHGIMSFGGQFGSCGVIAHEQGGAAALHVYSYYWSCLDYGSGGRMIQTVGTPFQGTRLAGDLLPIYHLLGHSCEPPADMSPHGSQEWLSGIPAWARAKTHYWTTSHTPVRFCDLVTSILLPGVDDGFSTKASGQLEGGENHGHTTGWCQSADMADPLQTTDAARNAEMNTFANH